MIFRPYISHAVGPYEVTGRKVSAWKRKLKAEQAALPLFAELIAERQLTPEQEMARRVALDWRAEEQARRDRHAAHWREARARYYALPVKVRSVVRDTWNAHRWLPKTSASMASWIWMKGEAVTVSAADMPPIADDVRQAHTRRLNDAARRADPWTRCKRAYSPGVMKWFAYGVDQSAEERQGLANFGSSSGLWGVLFHAVASYDDFQHNTDPHGDRRTGVVEAFGSLFRFEIFTRQAGSDEPCDVTWNGDVARRVLWIGLADEPADLSAATLQT